MSSLAGFCGLPSAPAYCASKAAVRVWGEGLRGRLGRQGIAVSVICPGFVRTPMTAGNRFPMPLIMTPERAAAIIRRGLVRRRARIAFPLPLYWASGCCRRCRPGSPTAGSRACPPRSERPQPAGFESGFGGGGFRRRLAGLQLAPGGDVAVVLGKRAREGVAALAVGDEVEVVDLGRIEHRLDRRPPRVGDRSGRQAVDLVGVVGAAVGPVLAGERAAEATLALGQAVDHGRIGLQAHAAAQPVDEHRRDLAPLVRGRSPCRRSRRA